MAEYKNKYRFPSTRASWWNYGSAAAYFITICTKSRNHYFGEINNKKLIYKNAGILADVFWYEITQHAKNVELGAFVVMPNHIQGILILTKSNHLQSPIMVNLNYGTINNGNNIIDNSDGGGENGGLSVKTGYPVETRHDLSLQTPLQTPMETPIQTPSQSQPQSEIILQSSNGNQLIDSESENTDLTKQIKNKEIPNFLAERFQNQGKNTVSSIIGSYKSAVTKHANRLRIEFGWQSRFHNHIIRDDAKYQRINDYIESNPEKWKENSFFD